MYSNYAQVKKYFESAKKLLESRQTMQEIFLEATTKHKNDVAITYYNEKDKKVSIKYRKYRSLCFEYASKLSQVIGKLPKNSVVAIKIANSPDWPFVFWGVLMNGCIPFLIDAKLQKENTENLLAQSEASAIITNEVFNYSVITANLTDFKDKKIDYRFAECWANNVIFCSSGTTGNVKLMVYDGKNMTNQIAACLQMPEKTGDIMYPGEVNILALIPFHHIFGFVAVFLWYTFFGKNIVFVKTLAPTEVMQVSRDCNVTHVYSVPLFWDSLAQSVLRKADLEGEKKAEIIGKMIAYNTKKITSDEAGLGSSTAAINAVKNQLLGKKIRFCISGGGYISNETMNVINGIGYPLYNGYGMTEAGVTSVELSSNVEYRLKGSIGKPLFGIEYKLVDTNPLHPNVGELMIKSPTIHQIEIINGVKQKPVFEDGFMRTGDIASVDEAGYYYLKGRIKDVIINENGENIYPDEIEEYFKDVEHITKVCVVGLKKGKTTHEDIVCVVEIANDVDNEMLKTIKIKLDEINNTLSNEKRVHEFLIAKNRMQLTASMKVKRYKIKEDLKSRPDLFLSFEIKKVTKTFEGYDTKDVEPIISDVRKIFSKTILLPEIKIGDGDHWINDLGGDSMSYVELITQINTVFNIEIPEEKYAVLTCVNDFTELILELKGIKKVK